jgi:cytoskeletal protein CcmA (bactofilin family)
MAISKLLTLISSDLSINGDLESSGEIQIDGKTDGAIRCQKLVITAAAVVRGTIVADTVAIAGQFNGEIEAREVVFAKSAQVIANVLQEQMIIEQGAFFEGTCRAIPGKAESGRTKVGLVATSTA